MSSEEVGAALAGLADFFARLGASNRADFVLAPPAPAGESGFPE
ncbi:hypothetical protein [Streptomyces californicus]